MEEGEKEMLNTSIPIIPRLLAEFSPYLNVSEP